MKYHKYYNNYNFHPVYNHIENIYMPTIPGNDSDFVRYNTFTDNLYMHQQTFNFPQEFTTNMVRLKEVSENPENVLDFQKQEIYDFINLYGDIFFDAIRIDNYGKTVMCSTGSLDSLLYSPCVSINKYMTPYKENDYDVDNDDDIDIHFFLPLSTEFILLKYDNNEENNVLNCLKLDIIGEKLSIDYYEENLVDFDPSSQTSLADYYMQNHIFNYNA